MNYKLERLSNSKVKLDFVLTKDKFQEALDFAFQKVVKNIEVKGFRKGKVPKEVFLKKFGEASLYEEAINYAVNKSYPEAVFNEKLEVVNQPEFDIDFSSVGSGKEFKYSVTVEVWPEVTLGQYKGLEVEKESEEVKPEEVDKYIKEVLKSKSELEVLEEGTLENGHIAVIDFEGFLNGEAFEGGKAENYSLEIGSQTFIPGFEDQLIGMKTGEERTIQVTFPEDYQAEHLKGKEVEFKVKLHEIKRRVIPDLSDEIVADLNIEGVSTAEEYRNYVLEKLQREKRQMVENTFIENLITKVCENAKTEVPEGLIEDELNVAVNQLENQARQYNLTAEQLLSFNGMTVEEYKEQLKEPAKKRVLERIVLRKISEVENFEIISEEINKQYEELAEMYRMDVNKVKQRIPEFQIKTHLGILKAIDLIKDTAIVKEQND